MHGRGQDVRLPLGFMCGTYFIIMDSVLTAGVIVYLIVKASGEQDLRLEWHILHTSVIAKNIQENFANLVDPVQ